MPSGCRRRRGTWGSARSADRPAAGACRRLRELMRTGETMNLTITPDGPRGPRRRLAAGLHLCLVAIGDPAGADRPGVRSAVARRRAWDQFAVPRPYSRARAVAGPKVQIPAGVEPRRAWSTIASASNACSTHLRRWPSSGPSRVQRWRAAARLATGRRRAACRGRAESKRPRSRTPGRAIRTFVLQCSGGRIENDGSWQVCLPANEPDNVLSVAQLTALIKDTLAAAISGRVGGGGSDRPGAAAVGAPVSDSQGCRGSDPRGDLARRGQSLAIRAGGRHASRLLRRHRCVSAARARYQLVIRQIEPRGLGALQQALRKLQQKLAAEGLFDPRHKKPLPRFPRRLAVITSPDRRGGARFPGSAAAAVAGRRRAGHPHEGAGRRRGRRDRAGHCRWPTGCSRPWMCWS